MSNEQTPGEILRAARELRGYQQSDVAERLRLSAQTIIDLEKDEYKHFSAEIYLRGHMKSYARLVNADLTEVLNAYERMDIQVELDPHAPVLLAQDISLSNRAHRTKRKTILWAGIGVLLVLIVMVILWWQEQQRNDSASSQVVSLVKPVATSLVPPESEPFPTNSKQKSEEKKVKPQPQSKAKKFTPDYSITAVKR